MFVLRNEPKKAARKAAPRLVAVTPENEDIVRLPSASPALRRSGRARNPAALPLYAAAFPVRFGGTAAASECPKHIADTQAMIDRVQDKVDRQEYRMDRDAAGLVRDLLDDARMFLAAARDNHENPRSAHDHARAFAKADAALGHARAAEVIQSRYSQAR